MRFAIWDALLLGTQTDMSANPPAPPALGAGGQPDAALFCPPLLFPGLYILPQKRRLSSVETRPFVGYYKCLHYICFRKIYKNDE